MSIVHNGHSIFPISVTWPTKKMQILSVTPLATHISLANISRRGLFSRKENTLIIGGGLALEDYFNLKLPGLDSSILAVLLPRITSWSQSHLGTTTKSSLGGCPSSQANRGGRLHKAAPPQNCWPPRESGWTEYAWALWLNTFKIWLVDAGLICLIKEDLVESLGRQAEQVEHSCSSLSPYE